ncbi:Hexosyltransferase [Sarracenia purpurea var. burkii]
MAYDTILARSFSSHDQKKLGCGAFVGCLIIALSLCTVFKPYLDPLPICQKIKHLRLPIMVAQKPYNFSANLSMVCSGVPTKETKQICNTSEPRSDVCETTGDVRIHGISSTIFVAPTSPTTHPGTHRSWIIRPYARKGDRTAMEGVKQFTVKKVTSSQELNLLLPHCTHKHTVPGIVFSTSGYVGNHFHDFTDVVVPLFLTSRQFAGEVKFLVANKQSWWITKYQAVLHKLSNYEIIDIDRESGVHCFPSIIIGLKRHKEFTIEPPYSMKDFRKFLRETYSLKREKVMELRDGEGKRRPRLLIIARRRTRTFVNPEEIIEMATSLGFEAVVIEAGPDLGRFAGIVNSCDVMMGVHGAGLTNIVFLPENAIFIQIVPLGGMEWLARTAFGEPAVEMNLKYLEYKIGDEESSLRREYPPDHQILRNPNSISKKGWLAFRSVYLDKQNVKLDVSRFRATLLEALKLLHQ